MSEPVKIVLPVIRRVMPAVMTENIKGVAPFMGPLVSIAALRCRAIDSMMEAGMTFEEALEKMNA